MAAEDAAAYLRQRPFGRVLALLRQRLIQLGRVGGKIRLPDPTPEELKALRAFVDPALKCRGDGSLLLPLQQVEDALRASRFGCSLRAALEAYFGAPLTTRAEAQAQEDDAWQRFCLGMGQMEPPGLDGFAAGYRSEWRQDSGALAGALALVFRAVHQLPGRLGAAERLPVFASRVAGDPHAFDAGRLSGRLLVDALAELFPAAAAGVEGEAARRALLLAAGGLLRDDLSSTVLAAGLDGPDPVLAAARRRGAALAYPLRAVAAWAALAAPAQVYVVENPAVFGGLLDGLAGSRPPTRWPVLVCTSGQPAAAAIALLDRLVQGGARLLYSGDFDLGGLRIARGLLRRYGERCRPWRMDPEAYQQALTPGAPRWGPREREQLGALAADFPELVPALLAHGAPAYQEALLPALLADLA